MPTFTYQLLAVFALSAPGLAVLIGFFYSERPRSAHTSVIISTTPPPPTAFVSLGVVLLAALAIHVATMCFFLLLDGVGEFIATPIEALRPYERLLDVARKGDPNARDLILSAVILLGQVAIGLAIGRTVPSLIISGRLPLASVYGWLTPYVAAARDDGKVVFASVILKANAKEGLLLGYDGVVASIRLDADFGVRTIVLDPANRFVLSMSPIRRGEAVETREGADVSRQIDGAMNSDGSRSDSEAMRTTVPSVTLSGAEIFSTSLSISDISDYASELDPLEPETEIVERSWKFRSACAALILFAPTVMLRWTTPGLQPVHLPKWTSDIMALSIAVLAALSMSTPATHRRGDAGRIDRWIVCACIISALVPGLAFATSGGAILLLAVVGAATVVSSVIALMRLSRAGEDATHSVRLLQTLVALAFVAVLQALGSRTPVDGFDVQQIGFSCFTVAAVFVAFALMMRTLTGGVLLCAWGGLVSLALANQARATAEPSLTLSLLLLGCVCIVEVMTFGIGSITSISESRRLVPPVGNKV